MRHNSPREPATDGHVTRRGRRGLLLGSPVVKVIGKNLNLEESIMFMKRTMVWLSLTMVLSLLAFASACGKKTEEPTNEAPGKTAKEFTPKGNEGTITGAVAYTGTPPAPKKIATDADPVCGQKNPNLTTEDTVVKDGKLANAFVYIKEGTLADGTKIGDLSFKTPAEAATLDQNDCHYKPHFSVAMFNPKVNIPNSNRTHHTIHLTP